MSAKSDLVLERARMVRIAQGQKRKALARKAYYVARRLTEEQKKVVEHAISTASGVMDAAAAVVDGDKNRVRDVGNSILYNPAAMEFMYDSQRLRVIPAMALLSKTNMVFWDILNDPDIEPSVKVKVGQTIHNSLKESGALSLYQRAYDQDSQGIKSNDELATEILRMKKMEQKAIESGPDTEKD